MEILTAADSEAEQRRIAGGLRARGLGAGDRVALLHHVVGRRCSRRSSGRCASGVVPVLLNAGAARPRARRRCWPTPDPTLVVDDARAGRAARRPTRSSSRPWPLARPMHYTSGTTGTPEGRVVGGAERGRGRGASWPRRPSSGTSTPTTATSSARRSTTRCRSASAAAPCWPAATSSSSVRSTRHGSPGRSSSVEPTTTFMVPAHLQRLLLDRRACPPLDVVPPPGPRRRPVPRPDQAAGRIELVGVDRVWEFYGSTEGQFTACSGPSGSTTRAPSAGPGPTGRLAADADGTIWCTVPGYARFEYWGDPAKTAAAWRATRREAGAFGAFTVGDLGRLDDDGYLYLDGRRDDLIITGGVNVYPAEVEQALVRCDGVDAVAVFGVDRRAVGPAGVRRRGGRRRRPRRCWPTPATSWRPTSARSRCSSSTSSPRRSPARSSGAGSPRCSGSPDRRPSRPTGSGRRAAGSGRRATGRSASGCRRSPWWLRCRARSGLSDGKSALVTTAPVPDSPTSRGTATGLPFEQEPHAPHAGDGGGGEHDLGDGQLEQGAAAHLELVEVDLEHVLLAVAAVDQADVEHARGRRDARCEYGSSSVRRNVDELLDDAAVVVVALVDPRRSARGTGRGPPRRWPWSRRRRSAGARSPVAGGTVDAGAGFAHSSAGTASSARIRGSVVLAHAARREQGDGHERSTTAARCRRRVRFAHRSATTGSSTTKRAPARAVGPVLDPDAAAVQADVLVDERQPEADAAVARRGCRPRCRGRTGRRSARAPPRARRCPRPRPRSAPARRAPAGRRPTGPGRPRAAPGSRRRRTSARCRAGWR